jgi:anti-sigma regulatory factor (Ser/Thr protein kinase)
MKRFEVIHLANDGDIGQARRSVRRCAAGVGFNERQVAEIEIAINELGTNAVKFARGTGQLYFSKAEESIEEDGIELIYLDKGPGIEDVSTAIEDGFTTAGTMGAGLGAIKRMADEFYIYSSVERPTRRLPLHGRTTTGTAIVFRKRLSDKREAEQQSRDVWGGFTRPAAGSDANGDAYLIKQDEDRLLAAIIDGLGHGLAAREAAREAVSAIERHKDAPVDNILRATHESLRMTRGAVAGLALIDRRAATIEYAGIGNADCRVISGAGQTRFISLNGTLGSRLDRIRVFKEQLPKVVTLVMSTDGISERWDLEHYPGLLGLHPQLLCAVIARDYGRPADDATILCGRLVF